MKKLFNIILTVVAIALASSCTKNELPSPWKMDFTIVASTENVRPVAYVNFFDPNYFYPCQVKVDGKIFSEHNASITTIQNVSGAKVSLPYLSPGKHQIEFIVGSGRKMYKDAEEAFGERVSTVIKEVYIESCPEVTIVLKNPLVDMDWGYWIPEKNIKEQCALYTQKYAIQVFPFNLNNEFTIENVSPEIKVEKTQTTIGAGIDVSFIGGTREGVKEYYFDIVAGEKRATVKIDRI